MPVICPACGTPIPSEDINVSTDVALCRRCDRSHGYAELARADVYSGVDPSAPPKGAWLRDDGVEIRVGATTRSLALAAFMLLFTAFWNTITWIFVAVGVAGLMSAINPSLLPSWLPNSASTVVPRGLSIILLLFMTPFVAIGLLTAWLALLAMFGRTEVRLRGDDGAVFTGIGAVGRARRFSAAAVESVSKEKKVRRVKHGEHEFFTIRIKADRVLEFGDTLTEERRRFLAAILRSLLLGSRR